MFGSLARHGLIRRSATLGLLATFAVSGLPGIAAACEGGGKEVEGILEIARPRAGNRTEIILQNDKALSVIIEDVLAGNGAGVILATSCNGALLKTGQGCYILQHNPAFGTFLVLEE